MIEKVTILVAIYKARRFIEHKIHNLLQQSIFSDCRIILLNCQDIECESEIYRPLISKHNNIVEYVFTNYVGLYKSWNVGLELSQSEYVMNSNCDDVMYHDCARILSSALDNNNDYDVAHGNHFVTDIPNQPWDNMSYHGYIETIYPLGTAGPCPMWRRSLHDRFGPFDNYRSIGDARIWERWHHNNIKFLNVPIPLCLYYHAPGHNLEYRLDPESNITLASLDLKYGTLP